MKGFNIDYVLPGKSSHHGREKKSEIGEDRGHMSVLRLKEVLGFTTCKSLKGVTKNQNGEAAVNLKSQAKDR